MGTREKILDLLKKEPLAQVEIAERLKVGQSTINHHVQVLEASGKIKVVKSIGKRLKIYTAR